MVAWFNRRRGTARARLVVDRLEGREVPATFTALNANDSGPGSLRQAILDANALSGFDAVNFDPAFFNVATPRTIALSAELLISDDLIVNGPGPAILSVSGGNVTRVFKVSNPATILNVSINGLTVTAGRANGGSGIQVGRENLAVDSVVITGNSTTENDAGGGIGVGSTEIESGGSLTVRNSTVSGNSAVGGTGGGIYFRGYGSSILLENSTVSGNIGSGGGGGIAFFGALGSGGFTIRNSTIAGNTASNGGGIFFRFEFATDTALIQNSTITGNTSTSINSNPSYGGGGILARRGTLQLTSDIVSGNTATVSNGRSDIATSSSATVTMNFSAVGDPDGFTPSAASGDNLPFGVALGLSPLANNGGPTQTVALAAFSPAIDTGTNPANLPADQRGALFPRSFGGGTDIGAFELQSVTAAPQVSGVAFNAGQADVTQRSRVRSATVTFNTQVTFAGAVAAAFDLSRIGGGTVGGFTATATVVGGVTVVALSGFTGGESEFGSLTDGRFTVLVRADQVFAGGQFLDGNGNGTGGDDYTLNGTVANGLYRLFGDVDGDGTVNAFDFARFRNAFGFSAGDPDYLDYLDINGNGIINAFDFSQFRIRFGATVP